MSSTCWPSTSRGPVQPLGVRRISIGHAGRSVSPVLARAPLDLGDAVERRVERGRERLVHGLGLVARHDHRVPAVAAEEREQLVLRDPREQRRVRDLVAVEVEDRQDRPVRRRVQELVRVPARRERPRLGLAVADDARDEQVGVVERRAERVRERVAELAALVDRARRLRRDVARDPAGERELAEEPAHAVLVLRDLGVDLGVRALEVGVRDEAGAAVAGAGDVDRAQVALADRAVQVDVEQVEAGRRAPVAEQPRLHVLRLQRLAQERVVEEVDLPDGEVVRGAPVGVDAAQLVGLERRLAGGERRVGHAANDACRAARVRQRFTRDHQSVGR